MNPVMIIVSITTFTTTLAMTIVLTVLAFQPALTHGGGWPPAGVGLSPINHIIASRACTLVFDAWACAMTLVWAVRHAKARQIQSSLLQVFY